VRPLDEVLLSLKADGPVAIGKLLENLDDLQHHALFTVNHTGLSAVQFIRQHGVSAGPSSAEPAEVAESDEALF
jgi:hypothetical protein